MVKTAAITDGKLINIKGINIRYTVRGSGAPVLLLHGIGEFLEIWWSNIEPLSEHFTVYAMDLPGHGLSDKPAINYTLPFINEFLSDFMGEMGIEHAHFIGHSLGGIIALSMATNLPEKVDKLVLVDCGGLARETPFMYRLAAIPLVGELLVKPTVKSSMRRRIEGAFYNPDVVTEEMVEKSYEFMKMPEVKRAMLKIMRNNVGLRGLYPESIMTDKLHLVKAPTLLIHGEQDTLIPLAHARNAAKLIPNARLEVLKECGHVPHIEKTTEFNKIVIEFLKSEGRVENVG